MRTHRPHPAPHVLSSGGFTLVELLVVISIILILAAMTIGAINLSVTSERVRSGARSIQSAFEGSRDRAIYAEEARGIRILVDESVTVDHDNDPMTEEIATTANTLVYIGSPGADESEPDSDDANRNGDRNEPHPAGPFVQIVNPNIDPCSPPTPAPFVRHHLIGVGTRWRGLYEQGLIGPGSQIKLATDSIDGARTSTEWLSIHPASFGDPSDPGVQTETSVFGCQVNDFLGFNEDDEVLILTRLSPMIEDIASGADNTLPLLRVPGEGDRFSFHFSLETAPDVLQGEDPIALPRNVVLNLWNSRLPSKWVSTSTATGTSKFSNRMDLLFSPNGAIVGDAGSEGIIHLHLCDIGDAISNSQPGSPTKPDGTPRDGDEFGITIFTQSGRVNVHPLDAPANPWQFGIEGELAR